MQLSTRPSFQRPQFRLRTPQQTAIKKKKPTAAFRPRHGPSSTWNPAVRREHRSASRKPPPRKAEALIKGDADLEYYTTYIGEGSPRFFLALNPVLPNESFALIVMMTKDAEARERLKARLEGLVAKNVIPEARLRIDRLNFGPPSASRCSSACSAQTATACARWPTKCGPPCAPIPTRATCSLIGTSRRNRFDLRLTRTARGRWGSRRRTSRRRSQRCSPAIRLTRV